MKFWKTWEITGEGWDFRKNENKYELVDLH